MGLGVRYLGLGVRYLGLGVRYLGLGVRYLGLGVRYLGLGIEVFCCALTWGQAPIFGRPPAHPSCGELDG